MTSEINAIRVPSDKLDALMTLVGELVIVKARFERLAEGLNDEQLNAVTEDLGRLTLDLRDNAFDIRMLPIGSIFGRFKRLVRDLCQSLNKEVDFVTQGEDTELDKVVLDRLADPLLHIIRNSMDHGIETPERRQEQGKSERGRIELSASHADGQVLIKIQDNGAGLNVDKIRQRAVERGLIESDDDLTDQQLQQLIFAPGFSTAEQVTDVSGRGVGMDVVRNSIAQLHGRVHIDSERGQGTCIRVYLPMTLAIIEGLTVRVAHEHYVIPLSVVEECIEADGDRSLEADGAR